MVFSYLVSFLCVFHKQLMFACLSEIILIKKWKNNSFRKMVPKFKWYFQYVESRMIGVSEGFCLFVVNKCVIISPLIYQIKYTIIKF